MNKTKVTWPQATNKLAFITVNLNWYFRSITLRSYNPGVSGQYTLNQNNENEIRKIHQDAKTWKKFVRLDPVQHASIHINKMVAHGQRPWVWSVACAHTLVLFNFINALFLVPVTNRCHYVTHNYYYTKLLFFLKCFVIDTMVWHFCHTSLKQFIKLDSTIHQIERYNAYNLNNFKHNLKKRLRRTYLNIIGNTLKKSQVE